MINAGEKNHETFVLPPSVVSKLDVSRIVREVEQIDSIMTNESARSKVGVKQKSELLMSEQLSDFLQANELTIASDGRVRTQLIKQLRLLKDKAPIIHMTFAVAADRESLGALVEWLRKSIHSQAVISVGLQPALVAGVYLRTPNKVFDMSLRGALTGRREVLVKELETYRAGR